MEVWTQGVVFGRTGTPGSTPGQTYASGRAIAGVCRVVIDYSCPGWNHPCHSLDKIVVGTP